MKNCVDIGKIQSFLDGELDTKTSESVSLHIGSCDDCANLLATAEEECEFAFTALENEFNVPVPTQRLWTKINQEIESERPTFWQTIRANFSFRSPSVLAFASLLLVFGTFIMFWNSDEPKVITSTVIVANSATDVEKTDEVKIIEPSLVVKPIDKPILTATHTSKSPFPAATKFASLKAKLLIPKPKVTYGNIAIKKAAPKNLSDFELVNGEDSYIKTIATLSQNIDSKKDTAMKPSARIDYERNIALVDSAISTMQKKARNNPKDVGAKQVLFSSYQNKIDLLSSVSEKTELMATLK
jgi:hypothetical protein